MFRTDKREVNVDTEKDTEIHKQKRRRNAVVLSFKIWRAAEGSIWIYAHQTS